MPVGETAPTGTKSIPEAPQERTGDNICHLTPLLAAMQAKLEDYRH